MKRMSMTCYWLTATMIWARAAPATEPDAAPYVIAASAQHDRSGEFTIISVMVRKTSPGGKPATTLAHPRVMVSDGQLAQFIIGSEKAPVTRPSGGPAESVLSGVRLDLVKPKGKEYVLVITTVWDDGAIVWAQSDKVPIGDHAAPNPPPHG